MDGLLVDVGDFATVAQEVAINNDSIAAQVKTPSMCGGFRFPLGLDSGLRRNDERSVTDSRLDWPAQPMRESFAHDPFFVAFGKKLKFLGE